MFENSANVVLLKPFVPEIKSLESDDLDSVKVLVEVFDFSAFQQTNSSNPLTS